LRNGKRIWEMDSRIHLRKIKIEKCEARFGPTGNSGKALIQIVFSAINAVSGYMEGVVVYVFNCRLWLVSDGKKRVDGQLFQDVVAMKEIKISSLDKLECIDKFCYLRDLIGAGGGAEKASRARVRCAW